LVDPGDGIFAGVIVARFIGTRQPLGSCSIYSIREIHCLASLRSRRLELKVGARRNGRERETREGRESACLEGLRKSFQLAFCECGYFQLVERLPREKVTALGEKTVNQ